MSELSSPALSDGRLVRIGFQAGAGDGADESEAAAAAAPVEASLAFKFLRGAEAAAPAAAGDAAAKTGEEAPAAAGDAATKTQEEAPAHEPDEQSDNEQVEPGNNAPESMKGGGPSDAAESGAESDEKPDASVAVKTEATSDGQEEEAKDEEPRGLSDGVKDEKETANREEPKTGHEETVVKEEKGQVSSEQEASHHDDAKKPDEESFVESKPTARLSEARSEDESEDANSHSRPARRGFHVLGVDFAPLNTPMRRRLQTLAVAQWLLSIAVLPVLCVLLMVLLLFTPLAPLVLAYAAWVFIFDRAASQRGGRRWEGLRRLSLWRHYRDYFPIRLVKSAELDPAHNYLIGYHPHGIISCGAFCNFGTEATGFSARFPGIRPYLLTLRVNFFWPLLRGYYLAAGLCDVSRPSIRWILGREGGGNAAIIVVGGAQEALDARPGNYRLTLLRRKGFARMALQTGAHLVPCYSFGENDLFRQASNPPGSRVRAFQQLFKGALGSSPPFFYGRGVFNYTFGLLPFRHEVITVVGAPIPVVKCPEPTPEQVDALHDAYIAQLGELFDKHKGRYGVPDDVRLEFV